TSPGFRMVSNGFRRSRPIPLQGDMKIPLQRHARKPGPGHAERAGSPLTYPTGLEAPSSESVSRKRPLRRAFPFLGEHARVRIGRRDVRVTNPDKVYFPKPRLTKGDLIQYYVDVAPCVLHHVRRRPMQMKRYPDGV